MIYLLQDCYKDDKGNYHDILKIGYSKDSFSKSRKGAYDTHNYGYKLLAEREGSVELETFLHKYYKDYQISTEWFMYNQEIVDNFLTIEIQEDTISKEDIISIARKNIINSISTPDELYKKYSNSIIDELKSIYNYSYKDILEFDEDLHRRRMKDIFEYFYRFLVNYWETHDYYNDNPIKELNPIVSMSEYENWKNRAELYYKTLDPDKQLTQEDFDNLRATKQKKTENLLLSYKLTTEEAKHDLAEAYQVVAKTMNYKDNYVAVNTHGGGDLIPVFNNLVMINDMRSYEVQQVDYKDRFRVFNALGDKVKESELVKKILEEFDKQQFFTGKMKYLYSVHMSQEVAKQVLDNIYDTRFSKYYWTIPELKAGGLNYQSGKLEEEYQSIVNPKDTSAIEEEVKDKILQTFQVDSRYAKSDIKETLRSIYESLNYNKTPKASDLENYFEIKLCKAPGSSGKQENGFKIIKQKGD